jgi:hypothetical protein
MFAMEFAALLVLGHFKGAPAADFNVCLPLATSLALSCGSLFLASSSGQCAHHLSY